MFELTPDNSGIKAEARAFPIVNDLYDSLPQDMAEGSNTHDAIVISDDDDETSPAPPSLLRRALKPEKSDVPTLRQHIGIPSHPQIGGTKAPIYEEALQSFNHDVSQTISDPLRYPWTRDTLFDPFAVDNLSAGSSKSKSPQPRLSQPTQLSTEPDICPYYYDEILEVKLYRGPGYEQFHPVVGTMEGHQEICDDWDSRQLKSREQQQRSVGMIHNRRHVDITANSRFPTSSQENPVQSTIRPELLRHSREQEQLCLDQALAIFPQIQHRFVRNLFKKLRTGDANVPSGYTVADTSVAELVISQIAEMDSFPKEQLLKRKSPAGSGEDAGEMIKWDKGMTKDGTYYKEALMLLAGVFYLIPSHAIHKTLALKHSLYDAYLALAQDEDAYNESLQKPYIRSKRPRGKLEKKYMRAPNEERKEDQYANIVNELQAARQQRDLDDTQRKRQKADEEAEEFNYAMHQELNSLVECHCCFDDVPINRMVSCENREAHFFCNKCVNMRANEQIGAMKHQMRCFDTSGCAADFSRDSLSQALPTKTVDKLAEIQQLEEIKAAGLDGLEQCPFCEFKAICLSVEVDCIFECLNPHCEKVSCRKCRGNAHLPQSCEEAKNDKGLSARHVIEEARSEAMMRACPKCSVKIIKSDGCNKMVCTKCSSVMCYVCKKDITGQNYQHFDSGTTGCPIQDNLDRHQLESDEAENLAIAAARARNPDVDVEELRIEAHLNKHKVRAPQPAPNHYPNHEGVHDMLDEMRIPGPAGRQRALMDIMRRAAGRRERPPPEAPVGTDPPVIERLPFARPAYHPPAIEPPAFPAAAFPPPYEFPFWHGNPHHAQENVHFAVHGVHRPPNNLIPPIPDPFPAEWGVPTLNVAVHLPNIDHNMPIVHAAHHLPMPQQRYLLPQQNQGPPLPRNDQNPPRL